MTEVRQATLLVCLPGMIGGFLGWLFGLMFQYESKVHPILDPLIGVFLGAGAAFVFVYVIANTERKDTMRLIGLALVAGFFWEPVWNIAGDLIEKQKDNRNAVAVENKLQDVSELFAQLQTTTNEAERTALVSRASTDFSILSQRIEDISDPKLRLKILPKAVEAAKSVRENPEVPTELQQKTLRTLRTIDPSITENDLESAMETMLNSSTSKL